MAPGANDGIILISLLVLGVVATGSSTKTTGATGTDSLIADSMLIVTGKSISVSLKHDAERADVGGGTKEISEPPKPEPTELAQCHVPRSLECTLPEEVARQLMVQDSVAAHAREELRIFDVSVARHVMAALTSADAFTARAATALVLILMTFAAPSNMRIQGIASGAVLLLVFLDLINARIDDASWLSPRFW